MSKIIIDADSIFFKVGYNDKASPGALKQSYRKFIKKICTDNFGTLEDAIVLVKGQDKSKEFRYGILENYKGKRPGLDEGLRDRLNMLYRYSIEWHECPAEPALETLETDDMVQIYAHEFWHADIPYVISHIDKDLDTIPGQHHNYNKGEFYEIDVDRARYHFFHQLLTGDTADNIPGIRGIGPKKATALLESTDPRSWYRTVRSRWHSRADMDASARCLFMGDPDTFTYDLRELYERNETEEEKEESKEATEGMEAVPIAEQEEPTVLHRDDE